MFVYYRLIVILRLEFFVTTFIFSSRKLIILLVPDFIEGPSKIYVTPISVILTPLPPYVKKRNVSALPPLCYATNHKTFFRGHLKQSRQHHFEIFPCGPNQGGAFRRHWLTLTATYVSIILTKTLIEDLKRAKVKCFLC